MKIYTTDIVVENIEFAESKNAGDSGDSGFRNIPEEMETEMPFR